MIDEWLESTMGVLLMLVNDVLGSKELLGCRFEAREGLSSVGTKPGKRLSNRHKNAK